MDKYVNGNTSNGAEGGQKPQRIRRRKAEYVFSSANDDERLKIRGINYNTFNVYWNDFELFVCLHMFGNKWNRAITFLL